ncbi:MAG: UDP-N-acetylmuramoyl-tripeptide--D-alanyl-D-alanine ligase [Sideroxydans sp.]|nr:UDP-N-acetylmuramoyl-tripeptide--D-alanyl-D-alanine ligase [Sideroxydans sp.]
MMLLSQAAQVLGARLIGQDAEFAAVSTDSRSIVAGDLFVALQGENFDGAQFVAGAAQSGAVAALVNSASYHGGEAACPLLLVEDTRLALGRLAAHWRAQFNIPVVVLTGSNGKTTVKEMLAVILREATGNADSVLATQGNLNNDIGMPLTLLKLRALHRYAVIEIGMNHPGEIDYLTRIACPDVALVNNASSAHLAGLGSVEAVAHAKGEIFGGLGENGIAVINADDPYAPLWRELAQPHRVIDFALDAPAAVGACWDVTEFGIRMEITAPEGEIGVKLQVPGAHNARNALAAAAAALALQVSLSAIVRGLEKFGGVAGRLQRKPARNGAVLIDDTYNANPASMSAALKVLAQAPGKRIFVMGDMGELGADETRFHAEVGAAARKLGIQQLLALGELSRAAVNEFGAGAQHFGDIDGLCAALDGVLGAGTTVLVKGSRFMKMERVVKHCTREGETCCSH